MSQRRIFSPGGPHGTSRSACPAVLRVGLMLFGAVFALWGAARAWLDPDHAYEDQQLYPLLSMSVDNDQHPLTQQTHAGVPLSVIGPKSSKNNWSTAPAAPATSSAPGTALPHAEALQRRVIGPKNWGSLVTCMSFPRGYFSAWTGSTLTAREYESMIGVCNGGVFWARVQTYAREASDVNSFAMAAAGGRFDQPYILISGDGDASQPSTRVRAR